MYTVADTKMLVEEGVISRSAARIIEERARSTMVTLAINTVLCAGIIFATFGLIFWLADAFLVAVTGILMLGGGLLVLAKGKELYAMFGNAATLIGAGMLLGGAGFELTDKYPDIAGWALALGGMAVAAVTAWDYRGRHLVNRFISGAVFLMALALHLTGVWYYADQAAFSGMPVHLLWLYSAAAIGLAGWFVDVRLVSALAIVPFAQALDTGTFYNFAVYAFYSQEPTLSILQMTLAIVVGLMVARRADESIARHARIHVMMAFVVANLCALVGSLWGDVVGDHLWGPARGGWNYENYTTYRDAIDAFKDTTLVIHEHVYSVIWALALTVTAFFAAHKNLRGLFNAAVTFGAIHAYTQMFETFHDEPLAYVVGGLAAIPLAWRMWRLNGWFLEHQQKTD